MSKKTTSMPCCGFCGKKENICPVGIDKNVEELKEEMRATRKTISKELDNLQKAIEVFLDAIRGYLPKVF